MDTIVSIPVRGTGCMFLLFCKMTIERMVSIPVRGTGCMPCRRFVRRRYCLNPREGYGMHAPIMAMNMETLSRLNPREGYGMHGISHILSRIIKRVSIPVRGTGCMGKTI